jgi:uncharacterized protein YndB with AHSA1/START domain
MTAVHTQLEVSRTIRADRERVFDAWTDPAKIMKSWGAGKPGSTRDSPQRVDRLSPGSRFATQNGDLRAVRRAHVCTILPLPPSEKVEA